MHARTCSCPLFRKQQLAATWRPTSPQFTSAPSQLHVPAHLFFRSFLLHPSLIFSLFSTIFCLFFSSSSCANPTPASPFTVRSSPSRDTNYAKHLTAARHPASFGQCYLLYLVAAKQYFLCLIFNGSWPHLDAPRSTACLYANSSVGDRPSYFLGPCSLQSILEGSIALTTANRRVSDSSTSV